MEKSYFIIESSLENLKYARYSAKTFNKSGHDYCILVTNNYDQLDVRKVSKEKFLEFNNLNIKK
jgi:hypothetical protein